MGKRISKAEIILQEARKRVEVAEQKLTASEAEVKLARVAFEAHAEAYNALEKSLARAPRSPKSTVVPTATKKSKPKPSTEGSPVSTGDGLESATDVSKCAVPNCGQPESATIHDPEWGIEGFHVFHAAIKKRKTVLPDNPEEFVHGASA